VPFDFHMVINMTERVSTRHIHSLSGQRPEREAVEGFEQLLA